MVYQRLDVPSTCVRARKRVAHQGRAGMAPLQALAVLAAVVDRENEHHNSERANHDTRDHVLLAGVLFGRRRPCGGVLQAAVRHVAAARPLHLGVTDPVDDRSGEGIVPAGGQWSR